MGLIRDALILLGASAMSLAGAHGQARAETGTVSFYAAKFNGRATASGERYDPNALTMAHKTLPFGTKVRVTNAANKRNVIVRVNDRGPHVKGRVADVSLAAARQLGMIHRGVVRGSLAVVHD